MNSATTPQPAEALPHAKHNATSRQIRGSSLMLVGRAISMGLNFLVQVLIVRYFANAKADYGAFAYALSIVALRPVLGPHIDRIGARRMLGPSIALVAAGLAIVPLQHDAVGLALAAFVFGAGFSTLYPAFSTHVLTHVPAKRHGAAFGAMLAAFDVGIGSGSLAFGALVARFGAGAAFFTGAALAACAWPLHLLVERHLGSRPGDPRAG